MAVKAGWVVVMAEVNWKRRAGMAVKSDCWRTLHILFLFCALSSTAYTGEVTGKVVNAQGGEVLERIRVTIVGTLLSAVTGADGSFHLSGVTPGSYVLQISGVGYRTATTVFTIVDAEEVKEFEVKLVPDSMRRTEVVEVHGDVFEASDWPAVGDSTLTSSELQQTSTVLTNDRFRSLQSLPGVSPAANDDLSAQFSVMGAPYEQVGVYVDDVLVPNLLHTIPNLPDAPALSLFTGSDIQDLQLMPVAYPMRYADNIGAALAIHTRSGSEGGPLFHVSIGLGDSELLGEGGFGQTRKGTWLFDVRKSYIGYLEQYLGDTRFSDVGFYDTTMKLTYQLTSRNTLSLFASGGQTHIQDPSLQASSATAPSALKKAANDLAIGRLGWLWTPTQNLSIDTRAAYVRTSYDQDSVYNLQLQQGLTREWSGGTIISWSFREGTLLQGGYSVGQTTQSATYNSAIDPQTMNYSSYHLSDLSQDAFAQVSQELLSKRLRLQGGIRWGRMDSTRIQPITGQASMAFQLFRNTQVDAGIGHYAQLALQPGFLGGTGADGEMRSAPIWSYSPRPILRAPYRS